MNTEEKVNALLKKAGIPWGPDYSNYFEIPYGYLYEKLLELVSESEAERIFLALVREDNA